MDQRELVSFHPVCFAHIQTNKQKLVIKNDILWKLQQKKIYKMYCKTLLNEKKNQEK